MSRKILFITTDQQRYDTLAVNGGTLSRTPVLDRLAREGIRYERCQPTSVVCMPVARSMLTGQFPSTHGAWMNGVPLAIDAPSVAESLHDAGYATALIGKAHFEPFMDPFGLYAENSLASLGIPTIEQEWFDGRRGVHRGFDYLEFATHGVMGALHYAKWMRDEHPDAIRGFYQVVDQRPQRERRRWWRHERAAGEVQRRAARVVPHGLGRRSNDPLARGAGRRSGLVLLDEFPRSRITPGTHRSPRSIASRGATCRCRRTTRERASERESLLDQKARHWRAWYDGRLVSNYEAPAKWVPATMTADQVREVNALNAVEVELIDEAIGRVLASIEREGLGRRRRRHLHQ